MTVTSPTLGMMTPVMVSVSVTVETDAMADTPTMLLVTVTIMVVGWSWVCVSVTSMLLRVPLAVKWDWNVDIWKLVTVDTMLLRKTVELSNGIVWMMVITDV